MLGESTIEQQLIAAGKTIKHCGDYGALYYHPAKKHVHWTMADSDGGDNESTSSEEIKRRLSLPGIAHVEIGDEWSPNTDEDPGWKELL